MDSSENPILPIGEPKALPRGDMKNLVDIKSGLSGYIKVWKSLALKMDLAGDCGEKHLALISYWEGVLEALNDPQPPIAYKLQSGF